MTSVSVGELSRLFRVLGQTLSMHATLRDRYARRALILDIVLLGCSVVFCTTTFASDSFLNSTGVSAGTLRAVLGFAAVGAFFASLVSLRADWKGKAARHRDAAQKLAAVLERFSRWRDDAGEWAEGKRLELADAYWEAMRNVIEAPEGQFLGLKSRHLRKVELSRMLDTRPGCPVLVLRLTLFCRSIRLGNPARPVGEEGCEECHKVETDKDGDEESPQRT